MARMRRKGMSRQQPKSVAVIGAGLAGAACANAFANKGYSVVVHEQAVAVACGASGVPIAMFAPSISSDDSPHSRLLRSGVNLLLQELHRLTDLGLLTEGTDWAMSGVLERCIRAEKRLPSTWLVPQDPLGLRSRVAGKPYPLWPAGHEVKSIQELFHAAAGWVNPARAIAAWLTHPDIQIQTNSRIANLESLDADVIVLASGYQAPLLVPILKSKLQPIRGQVEWGTRSKTMDFDRLSPNGMGCPVNGMGHFIHTPSAWLAGATFQRDETDLAPRLKDVDLNFEKLATLMPEIGKPYLAGIRVHSTSWVGVRTAQKNRQPLVQKVDNVTHPNTWVCTGLGSRGLSLAALCASRLVAGIDSSLAFA
jgi:tRNA 5-methylaminomethyl-2-thiouridine biosynthesis bifunctional protein